MNILRSHNFNFTEKIFSVIIIVLILSLPAFSINKNELNESNTPVFQEDPYLPFAEVMPEPVGGLEAIYKKITYPEIAKRTGLEGKVYLLISINETGGVDDVKVIKGIGGGCDEAAIKGVMDTKFSPGKNKGTTVKTKLSLSVNFKLK